MHAPLSRGERAYNPRPVFFRPPPVCSSTYPPAAGAIVPPRPSPPPPPPSPKPRPHPPGAAKNPHGVHFRVSPPIPRTAATPPRRPGGRWQGQGATIRHRCCFASASPSVLARQLVGRVALAGEDTSLPASPMFNTRYFSVCPSCHAGVQECDAVVLWCCDL